MINGALSAPKNCLTSSYQLSSIAFRPEALEDIFNIANFFRVLKFTPKLFHTNAHSLQKNYNELHLRTKLSHILLVSLQIPCFWKGKIASSINFLLFK